MAHIVNTPIGVSATAASYGQSVVNGLLEDINESDDEHLSKGIRRALESLILVDRNLKRSADIISRIKLISSDNYGMKKVEFGLNILLENVVISWNDQMNVHCYKVNLS